ncbi:MAG: 16S rRNA (cytosine(1402)-N(4))-methyltransferase RsmH [Anaerolineaceae bacterium]|nr:MAG: 16S rRNA (cytosine(1402)-N(4))-methyltransferase RsmH [Anaerolineaceae bacterium]
MDDEAVHVPVLYHEVLELLQPKPNGRYIDGTLGAGGHTAGILRASAPNGRVLVFDRDPEAIKFTRKRLSKYGNRIVYINANYAEMDKFAPANGFTQIDGILLDLGLSSRQLANGQRGFSFLKEGPLDMRYDPSSGPTAADLLNNLAESDLVDIFRRYGEVSQSRRIAKLIVANRPLSTTTELAQLISSNVRRNRRIHPATQLFQALRIAVNQELDSVEHGLQAAVDLLKPGGRLAVISFHSLEDRFVKRYFRDLSRDCICPPQQPVCTCSERAKLKLVKRKAILADEQEIANNPRSRSARLRVAEKLQIAN